ncbi:tetratricopeptide repeat protein [Bacteroidota bacterium]
MKLFPVNKILLFVFIIFSPLISLADEHDALVREANDLYSRGEYQEAGLLYDSVINLGFESGELYYNLGNSYFKQNKITDAIINFERALLLTPEDKDIKYNLSLANNLVLDNIDELPVLFINTWLQNLINMFSSIIWSIFSVTSFIILIILGLIYFFSARRILKKISFLTAIFCLFLSISTFIFASVQNNKITKRETAIIYSPSVTMKSSPDESGTDLFLLHEGTKIQVIDSLGDWREIKLSDGNKAWLKYSDIVII